jgi:hypothetical protein
MYTQDEKGESAKWAAVASQARERRWKEKVGHNCRRSTQGNRGGELGHSCLVLNEARRGAFIRKDEAVRYMYSTGESKG